MFSGKKANASMFFNLILKCDFGVLDLLEYA